MPVLTFKAGLHQNEFWCRNILWCWIKAVRLLNITCGISVRCIRPATTSGWLSAVSAISKQHFSLCYSKQNCQINGHSAYNWYYCEQTKTRKTWHKSLRALNLETMNNPHSLKPRAKNPKTLQGQTKILFCLVGHYKVGVLSPWDRNQDPLIFSQENVILKIPKICFKVINWCQMLKCFKFS